MTRRSAVLFTMFVTLLLLAACSQAPAPAEQAVADQASTMEAIPASNQKSEAQTNEDPLAEVIQPREPLPATEPGPISQEVEKRFARADGAGFLGLDEADWINLAISLLMVGLSYLIGTWIIRRLLPPLVQRTRIDFDDQLLQDVSSELRWLVVILALHLATLRLGFLSVGFKQVLIDIYFVLGLAVVFHMAWKTIALGEAWFRAKSVEEQREEQLAPGITAVSRLTYVLATVVAVSVLLSHFGVNVLAFSAALGLTGLALSLAAKDTLADIIAGFMVLIDQPFRVGDRIEIQEIGTWGDVVEIGLRTTSIRTRDNRMVIVPNSIIGKNQVVNYTFPDPRFRIQTHVGIDYDTDIEAARRVIVDTVRKVDGVLQDKPVDALYVEMGETAMIFRVRWWIASYEDTRRMFDKVHTSLQQALDEAGIEIPFTTYDVNLKLDNQNSDVLIPAG
ncbi:MAG: mechanosensitive ion channel family protein [Chloroflexota bacterium]|nr:mechanosensitive ion channel family protein [Chloroflexota bacterium]